MPSTATRALDPIVPLAGGPVWGQEVPVSRRLSVRPGAAVRPAALRQLDAVSEALALRADGVVVCVDLARALIRDRAIGELLDGAGALDGLMLEVPSGREPLEREDVARLHGWRARGALLALDRVIPREAGARTLLELRPDVVKLAPALVRGVARHTSQRLAVEAIAAVSRAVGAQLVAVGADRSTDQRALAAIGVGLVQRASRAGAALPAAGDPFAAPALAPV